MPYKRFKKSNAILYMWKNETIIRTEWKTFKKSNLTKLYGAIYESNK